MRPDGYDGAKDIMPNHAAAFSYVFTRSVSAAALVRAALMAELEGSPGEFVDRVLLTVSELVTNVVRHTADGGGEVAFRLDARGAHLRVSDHDTTPLVLPTHRPPPGEPGGRGLFLVCQLTVQLDVRITTTGKDVIATVPLVAPRELQFR